MNTPGQSNWPATDDNKTSLVEAANLSATTLPSTIDSTVNSIPALDTSTFPPSGIFWIEKEAIIYKEKTQTSFTKCIRGSDGTSPATHTSGKSISGNISAAHHTTLAAAIISMQTSLRTCQFSGCKLSLSAPKTIPNARFTPLTFDYSNYITKNYWQLTPSPQLITIPASGFYRVTAQVRWSTNSTGIRYHEIKTNTSLLITVSEQTPNNSNDLIENSSATAKLVTGQTLSLNLFQSSGSNLTVIHGSYTFLEVEQIGW